MQIVPVLNPASFTRPAGKASLHFSLLITPSVTQASTGCMLALKVIPNAPRDAVAGWLGDALKVKLHAPALEGRANAALMGFLADRLALPRRAIALAHGAKSRQKFVRIDGLTLAEVRRRLDCRE